MIFISMIEFDALNGSAWISSSIGCFRNLWKWWIGNIDVWIESMQLLLQSKQAQMGTFGKLNWIGNNTKIKGFTMISSLNSNPKCSDFLWKFRMFNSWNLQHESQTITEFSRANKGFFFHKAKKRFNYNWAPFEISTSSTEPPQKPNQTFLPS